MAKKTNDERFKDRKDKVKTSKYYRKYVERDPQSPTIVKAIYCKGCGTQIKGLRNILGVLVMVPYWNYTDMTLEFDDGSAHTTPICIKCSKVANAEALEAMYMADLEEFEVQDIDKNKNRNIWDIYLNRVPKGIAGEAK